MSKAMSIEWHKTCLKNWRQTLDEMEKELMTLQTRVERSQREFSFYEKQINEAAKTQKKSFDRNKYLLLQRP